MKEEEWKVCKVRFFPTVSTPLTHVLPAHQRLEAEFLLWEELHHLNVLPFYGAYMSLNYYPEGSHGCVGAVKIGTRLFMVGKLSHVRKHGYIQLP